jgi:diguanylate cyclase (GGDEF)-like protein
MLRNTLHGIRRGSLQAMRLPALVWLPLVAVLGGGLGAWWGAQQARDQALAHAEEQLRLAAVQVHELLDRYELFPDIAAFCPCIGTALAEPDDPGRIATANRRLADINARIRADVSYVLDTGGTVIAASNWRDRRSFVGENYALRPYFRAALAGGTGRFVGVGLTSGELGYYLARPVTLGERVAGVIAVKLRLDELERWLAGDEDSLHRGGRTARGGEVLIADAAGVIFVTTESQWRFRTLAPLAPAARAALAQSRAYAGEALAPLAVRQIARLGAHARLLALPGHGRAVAATEYLPDVGWRLTVLSPLAGFVQTLWLHVLLGLLLGMLVVALVLLLVLRELYQRRVLEAAIRDPLTGLYTRMYMNETVPRLVSRHNRDADAAFGVTILDVDFFKQVNDHHGHFAGDRVLAELGALIRAQCEDTDIAVRLGGEELAIFRPHAAPGEALRLAERLRILVQRHAVRWEGRDVAITISGGVAEHRAGESLVQLLQRADRALYQAKRTGRNRIIDADPPTDGGLPPGLCARIDESSGAAGAR